MTCSNPKTEKFRAEKPKKPRKVDKFSLQKNRNFDKKLPRWWRQTSAGWWLKRMQRSHVNDWCHLTTMRPIFIIDRGTGTAASCLHRSALWFPPKKQKKRARNRPITQLRVQYQPNNQPKERKIDRKRQW